MVGKRLICASSLAALSIVVAGCAVKVPRHPAVKLSLNAAVHAEARPAVPMQGAEVVEFFGIPLDDADDIVFVLDRSGSMNDPAQGQIARLQAPDGTVQQAPRKIDVAHAELADALERLAAGTRTNVLFFNNTLEAFAPDLVPLEESKREGFVGFVRGTVPSGGTALAPAMRTAFLMNARRIVLLSDGLGNIGGNASAVLRDAREAMLGGVRIDTIGIGSKQDALLLGALAAESGGLYQRL